jgi:hypothetical protein
MFMADAAQWLLPEHFAARDELDADAMPMVMVTSVGEAVNVEDLVDTLQAARDQRRPVVLEIRDRDGE